MKEIPLTQNKVALIDDEDYEDVSKFHWRVKVVSGSRTLYAIAFLPPPVGRNESLHRFILNSPQGISVDHINRNGLDCRRSNLRLATGSQNQANSLKRRNNTSGFKGVYYDRGKWNAHIQWQHKKTYVGRFSNREDAARAYDAAALRLQGEFAVLNFPKEK